MRSLLPIGALVLLIATLACTEKVESGAGGGTGTTTSGGGTTNTGGAAGTIATGGNGGTGGIGGAGGGGGAYSGEAISLLYSQFPSSSGTTSSSSSGSSSSTSTSTSSTSTSSSSTSTTSTSTTSTSTTSTSTSTSTTTSTGGPDPNTLYVILSNMTVACSDPHNSACGQWQVSVGIPPSLQQPGQIALSNPQLNTYYSVMDQSCTGSSGGSFTEGSLQLVSLTSQAVEGVFSGTSTFQVDVNGAFTAPRCP